MTQAQAGRRGDGWISVEERLPELRRSVALLNSSRWENVGDWDRNVHDAGYLERTGICTYWSVRGQRALPINSYTHWMPLPDPPVGGGKEGDK